MAEQLADLCSTTVAGGGYTAGSGVLNVVSTSTGSGPLPFPGTGTFSVGIANPTTKVVKALLEVTGINSPTQFAVTSAAGLDVNCLAADLVQMVIDKRALLALLGTSSAGVLASAYITANEGLAAGGAYTDLTTPDSVTFTLSATTKVVVQYTAYANSLISGSSNLYYSIVNVDGTDITSPTSEYATNPPVGGNCIANVVYAASLGAGAHTIKIRHKVGGSGTGNWTNRLLVVSASA